MGKRCRRSDPTQELAQDIDQEDARRALMQMPIERWVPLVLGSALGTGPAEIGSLLGRSKENTKRLGKKGYIRLLQRLVKPNELESVCDLDDEQKAFIWEPLEELRRLFHREGLRVELFQFAGFLFHLRKAGEKIAINELPIPKRRANVRESVDFLEVITRESDLNAVIGGLKDNPQPFFKHNFLPLWLSRFCADRQGARLPLWTDALDGIDALRRTVQDYPCLRGSYAGERLAVMLDYIGDKTDPDSLVRDVVCRTASNLEAEAERSLRVQRSFNLLWKMEKHAAIETFLEDRVPLLAGPRWKSTAPRHQYKEALLAWKMAGSPDVNGAEFREQLRDVLKEAARLAGVAS